MASTAAKAKRRAEALNELDQLSNLLAEKMKVEVPNLRPVSRDPELQRIERVEAINGLLRNVLSAGGVEIPAPVETSPEVTEAQDEVTEEVQPKASKKAGKRRSKGKK